MPTQPFQYTNYHNGNQHGQPFQGYQPVPPLVPIRQQRAPRPANPYKRFNNWNYCYTHGHDVKESHNSTNCLNPAQGHMWHAIKQNTCGGSTRGQHKVMYPAYPYSMSNNKISDDYYANNNVS